MTAPVSSTPSTTRSRRVLLAGALGGLGAWAASAVGRASPVRAADGETVHVGDELTATSVTKITNSTTNDTVLWGRSTGDGVGVLGTSQLGTGVLGSSGSFSGVSGSSTSGTGVDGFSGSGRAVAGYSPSGIGLYGQSPNGIALQASGRARFSTSGVAGIKAGATSKTVTPGVDVTSASFVLLTPKVNIGSRALWFTTNATANTFTIHISSARSSGTLVAWLLLG